MRYNDERAQDSNRRHAKCHCHGVRISRANATLEAPNLKLQTPEKLQPSNTKPQKRLVFSDPRYGDLVFLVKANGDIIHSCVFLADDIVYTKNGGHFTAPWMLATIPDLVDNYSAYVAPEEKLTVAYYRNKYY